MTHLGRPGESWENKGGRPGEEKIDFANIKERFGRGKNGSHKGADTAKYSS